MRLIWIRNLSKAVRRGQKSVNRPNEQFNTQGHSLSFFLGFRISAPVHLVLLELRIEWTKLLGIYFTLYQDCINLRIKTHTTKNIINNKLLLWQRGVHWFQTAVPTYTDSLVKCLTLYGKKMFTVHTGKHSHLVPSRPWFPEIRMFT